MILTILRILYLRLRNNPLELLLVFVMPVVFFSIFAAIFSNGIATGSDKKLRIGWITARQTALGSELRSFLEANSSLQCFPLVTQAEATSERSADSGKIEQIDSLTVDSAIADAQRSGRYDLIIRLPKDFPAELSSQAQTGPCPVYLVTDGQNPMALAMVTSIVKGFFAQQKASLVADQLTRLNSAKRPSGGSSTSSESRLPNVDSLIDVPQSRSTQRPQLQYFDQVNKPSQIIEGGVRFFDPMKDGSKVFEDISLSPLPVANSTDVSSIDGAIDARKALLVNSESALRPGNLDGSVQSSNPGSEIDGAVSISIENPQSASQVNPRIAMYAAGIAVLFLLFSSTGNAAALLEESESGTLDRILVSKAGLFHIIGGKWLGIFLLGCIQISVMFLWAELVFQIQLWKHLGGFAVMTFCTAAATSSFAMLMATLCSSRAQLNAASVVIILSMSAVGGSMIPRFAMSDRMKEIGKWTFNAWALDGYQKVFWFQSPISSLQTEATVLLASALVFGVLALIFSLRWKCQ